MQMSDSSSNAITVPIHSNILGGPRLPLASRSTLVPVEVILTMPVPASDTQPSLIISSTHLAWKPVK